MDLGRKRFAASGVKGVENPERLSEFVPTQGWHPVDAQVRVGHVASLVTRLGGEQLYGDDESVPLRELIQNAADAVRARRIIEDRDAKWGTVILRTGEDQYGAWIEIEDNGVGMSRDVLTGPLLDFGACFWSTPDAVKQFPSLISRGFESIGQYGIGFFSVFMWGDRVRVTTRRYDEAIESTRVLEFESGLSSRPLLRAAAKSERIRDGGTRVRVWLRTPRQKGKVRLSMPSDLLEDASIPHENFSASPSAAASVLCVALDVDLMEDRGKVSSRITRAGDWARISGEALIKRTTRQVYSGWQLGKELARKAGKNVRPLYHEQRLVGRACVIPDVRGCISIGGFRSRTPVGIAGLLLGESVRVSRDKANLLSMRKELKRWATEQAKLVPSLTNKPEQRAECAHIIGVLGGETGSLPVAKVRGRWVDFETLSRWARPKESIILISDTQEEKCSAPL